jgi:hypothetical protein
VQVAVDGVGVEAAVLQAGDTRHYTGKTAIMMVLGNAGGLTMKLNEREISSLGKRGEVRQFTITPENAAQFGSN